ncbi:hypothetical protein ERAN111884_03850 [Erysipelothrix anatis]
MMEQKTFRPSVAKSCLIPFGILSIAFHGLVILGFSFLIMGGMKIGWSDVVHFLVSEKILQWIIVPVTIVYLLQWVYGIVYARKASVQCDHEHVRINTIYSNYDIAYAAIDHVRLTVSAADLGTRLYVKVKDKKLSTVIRLRLYTTYDVQKLRAILESV